jgi:hypothetical protein
MEVADRANKKIPIEGILVMYTLAFNMVRVFRKYRTIGIARARIWTEGPRLEG